MKTQVIKVQNPKIIGGYRYYLVAVDKKQPSAQVVAKITEKQAAKFLNIKNIKNENRTN